MDIFDFLLNPLFWSSLLGSDRESSLIDYAQNFPASDCRFSLCKQHTVQFKAKDPPYNARFSTVPLTALFIYSL